MTNRRPPEHTEFTIDSGRKLWFNTRAFAKFRITRRTVAQSVEHLTFNEGVAGSIPASPTITSVRPLRGPLVRAEFLSSWRRGKDIQVVEDYACAFDRGRGRVRSQFSDLDSRPPSGSGWDRTDFRGIEISESLQQE